MTSRYQAMCELKEEYNTDAYFDWTCHAPAVILGEEIAGGRVRGFRNNTISLMAPFQGLFLKGLRKPKMENLMYSINLAIHMLAAIFCVAGPFYQLRLV